MVQMKLTYLNNDGFYTEATGNIIEKSQETKTFKFLDIFGRIHLIKAENILDATVIFQ